MTKTSFSLPIVKQAKMKNRDLKKQLKLTLYCNFMKPTDPKIQFKALQKLFFNLKFSWLH